MSRSSVLYARNIFVGTPRRRSCRGDRVYGAHYDPILFKMMERRKIPYLQRAAGFDTDIPAVIAMSRGDAQAPALIAKVGLEDSQKNPVSATAGDEYILIRTAGRNNHMGKL